MEEWVDKWALPEMFAGIPGRGAEEAWYIYAALIEQQRIKGSNVCAGSADVFKCFDQIQRELLYDLLKLSGMPDNIVDT